LRAQSSAPGKIGTTRRSLLLLQYNLDHFHDLDRIRYFIAIAEEKASQLPRAAVVLTL
jgi:hypothetical protein